MHGESCVWARLGSNARAWGGCALVLALLAGCAATPQQKTALPQTPTATVAATPTPANRFVDPKLGFSLDLPAGWSASAESGLQPSPQTAAITLSSAATMAAHQQVTVAVISGSTMPAAFAAHGTPGTTIGKYPAFADDRVTGEARAPCLVRIFLAQQDYVMADWCGAGISGQATAFEQILATYQPAAATFTPHVSAAPAPLDCGGAQAALGYTNASGWGRQLGSATATNSSGGWQGWTQGATTCSNDNSPDLYLFQCTELVNRFLYEQWALPHIPGNAARYLDYYQDGVLHPGVVRDLPASLYAISDDASQGQSAFAPRPGDIIVYQDVADAATGWTSGLTTSPGHVAVVTAVDATQVFVAQENYSDSQYFMSMTMQTTARGYHLVDRSGLPDRIVRGWIHFNVAG